MKDYYPLTDKLRIKVRDKLLKLGFTLRGFERAYPQFPALFLSQVTNKDAVNARPYVKDRVKDLLDFLDIDYPKKKYEKLS